MLPGVWNQSAAQRIAVTTLINHVAHPAEVEVDHQMYDAHPTMPATSASSTASITVHPSSPVQRHSPEPVARSVPGSAAKWPPLNGDPVTVDVGDGVQSFRLFGGMVDQTAGAITDATTSVDAIDFTERLDALVSSLSVSSEEPTLAARVPLRRLDGTWGNWRYPGLCSTYHVDRAARAAGFFACAPTLWETKLAASMMGSAMPEIGRLEECRRQSNPASTQSPPLVFTDWGLGMVNMVAHYSLSTPTGAGTPITVAMDLPTRNQTIGGVARISLSDTETYTNPSRGFQLAYDHDTDEVYVGLWRIAFDGTFTETRNVIPRNGATRVALRCRSIGGTQTLIVRRDNDPTETTFTHSSGLVPDGWHCAFAVVYATGPIGGVTVADTPTATLWGPLTTPRTARIRVKEIGWMRSGRALIDSTAREVLTSFADAECASWWIDRSGVLQWAGRGVLEEQPITATLTTADSLEDLQWTRTRDTTAQQVRLQWMHPVIDIRSRPTVKLWTASGASGLVSGDVWEDIASPRDNEDWHNIDTQMEVLTSGATRADIIYGTVAGSELLNTTNDGNAWGNANVSWTQPERLNFHAWAFSANVWGVAADHEINFNPPDSSSLPTYWKRHDLPILRGHGRTKWGERRDAVATITTATTGRTEYLHDCSWIVQDSTRRAELRSFMATELGKGLPRLERVKVRPDPRVEVGDRITLADPNRTGLTLTAVVQGIQGPWRDGDAECYLTCRITGWSRSAVAALPALHWLQDQTQGQRAI